MYICAYVYIYICRSKNGWETINGWMRYMKQISMSFVAGVLYPQPGRQRRWKVALGCRSKSNDSMRVWTWRSRVMRRTICSLDGLFSLDFGKCKHPNQYESTCRAETEVSCTESWRVCLPNQGHVQESWKGKRKWSLIRVQVKFQVSIFCLQRKRFQWNTRFNLSKGFFREWKHKFHIVPSKKENTKVINIPCPS